MAMFLAAFVSGIGSAVFLFTRKPWADRLAVAGAELTVVLGLIVLVTGPLWARKAWGVWWQWDARLTSTLVMWLIFNAYLLLRRYGGPGSDRLAAARRAVRHGQRAVRLLVGERLADAAPEDLGGPVAAARACAGRSGSASWRSCCVSTLLLIACATELEKRRQELDALYLAAEE